ncbi:1096_t:CDS:10, partial [Ambispora leptoticha]
MTQILRKLSTITFNLNPTMAYDQHYDPERYQPLLTKPPPIKVPKTCEQCREDYVDMCCFACEKKGLPKNWTSGNSTIDNFIKDIQSKANNQQAYLQWLKYESFSDIKQIGKIGKKNIYSAVWYEGPITRQPIPWGVQSNHKVILKETEREEQNLDSFLEEVLAHWQFRGIFESRVLRCFGISRNPSTNALIMVMEYFSDGDLGHCLREYYSQLQWEHKISILEDIANGLAKIHDTSYALKDFHGGNILINLEGRAVIADMTLSFSDGGYPSSRLTGVLPYIAPEILKRQPIARAANIYSFGIIMWELATGERAFANRAHDDALAMEIYRKLRPRIPNNIPECFAALIRQCWHSDPYRRPMAKEIAQTFQKWGKKLGKREFTDRTSIIYIPGEDTEIDAFHAADISQQNNRLYSELKADSEHPNAQYITRDFDYPPLDEVLCEYESEDDLECFPTNFGQLWNESEDKHGSKLKRSNTLLQLKKTSERRAIAQFALQLQALAGTYLARCYGFSRDPKTGNFVIVYEYVPEGNLGHCLTTQFSKWQWWHKLQILNGIAIALRAIHKSGHIHKDLHLENMRIHEINGPSSETDYVGEDVEKMKRHLSQFLQSDARMYSNGYSKDNIVSEDPLGIYTSRKLDFAKRRKSSRPELESSRSSNTRSIYPDIINERASNNASTETDNKRNSRITGNKNGNFLTFIKEGGKKLERVSDILRNDRNDRNDRISNDYKTFSEHYDEESDSDIVQSTSLHDGGDFKCIVDDVDPDPTTISPQTPTYRPRSASNLEKKSEGLGHFRPRSVSDVPPTPIEITHPIMQKEQHSNKQDEGYHTNFATPANSYEEKIHITKSSLSLSQPSSTIVPSYYSINTDTKDDIISSSYSSEIKMDTTSLSLIQPPSTKASHLYSSTNTEMKNDFSLTQLPSTILSSSYYSTKTEIKDDTSYFSYHPANTETKNDTTTAASAIQTRREFSRSLSNALSIHGT